MMLIKSNYSLQFSQKIRATEALGTKLSPKRKREDTKEEDKEVKIAKKIKVNKTTTDKKAGQAENNRENINKQGFEV